MSNSIETRSTSALFKRAEQLRRWQESETNREPNEPKRSRLMPFMTSSSNSNASSPNSHTNSNTTTGNRGSSMRLKEGGSGKMRVRFMDGCVFLAACAAADKEEVEKLTERGADIDTANVDGLTALHQACIDDNLEMVEFLVQRGSDVNRGDNEGWTPLHATASCGFISIARYLIDHGANVSAVNNDGELAIDIAESDEMEILLQKEIDARGIDCDEARNTEERLMLEDARQWLNAKQFKDTPHPKTGATALHVAAAKGYIKVMSLLIQSGAATNAQDLDGWTPLHAAAHWAQREACELLCENYANMDIKNYVGQTCFDVADPDVIRLLEELKKKQNTLQKDRPEIRNLINRPAIPAGTSPANTGKRSSLNNNTISAYNYNSNLNDNDRSSITRLSIDDKALRSKEVSTQERDLLLNKSTLVSETIPEANRASDSDKDSDPDKGSPDDSFDDDSDLSESEKIHAQTKAGLKAVSKRNRALQDTATKTSSGVPRITLNKEEQSKKSASINDISKKTADEANDNSDVYPWRRPASLRARPTNTVSSSVTPSKLSPSKEEEDVQLRRVHSFESDEKFYARLTELRNRIRATSLPVLPGGESEEAKTTKSTTTTTASQRPLRDDLKNNNNQHNQNTNQTSNNPSNKSVSDNKSFSSSPYLSNSLASSHVNSSPSYYSSLPRNPLRHLPSLPENATTTSTPSSSSSPPSTGTFKVPLSPRASLKDRPPQATPPIVRSMSLKDNAFPSSIREEKDKEGEVREGGGSVVVPSAPFRQKSPDGSRRRPASTTRTPLITDLITKEGVGTFKDTEELLTNPQNEPGCENLTTLELGKRREDQLTRPKSDTNLQPHQVRSDDSSSTGSNSNGKSPVPSTPEILAQLSAADKAGITNVFKQFFKSFVPPVRDEESETQRKAHAKRVRETRRSTQGVTLEDLKSAEQLVKKSKQQEQQQRTSELQQLAATTTSCSSGPLGSTATTTVSVPSTTGNKTNSSSSSTTSSSNSNFATSGDADRAQERRPSWRLKMEGGTDRNRFRLEDSRASGDNDVLAALRKPSAGKGPPNSSVPSISLTDERGVNSPATGSGHSPKPAIQRRKKPKRRSTGVVKLGDLDDKDEDESDSEDEDDTLKSLIPPSLTIAALEKEARDGSGSVMTSLDHGRNLRSSSDRSVSMQSRASSDDELIVLRKDDLNTLLTAKPTVLIGRELSLNTDGARQSGSSTLGAAAKSNSSHNQNGADVDYKKLWEESQKENGRLREDLDKVKSDLNHTKRQLDGAKSSTSGSSGTGLSDAEKREKKALERKLSEMEEELKQLQKLKVENERLKSENRALTRVVSKLTAAASAMPPSKSGSAGSSGTGSGGSSASGPN